MAFDRPQAFDAPHDRRFGPERRVYQVVKDGTRDAVDRGVRCVPAATFLAALA